MALIPPSVAAFSVKYKKYISGIIFFSAVIVSVLWPEDHFWGKPAQLQLIFWNYPEQIETIKAALIANAHSRLAINGIKGSIPVVYHPFHIWIYQFFLLIHHNLISLVFIKHFATLCICLSGLYYLSRLLVYPVFPILLFIFSPFCYIYSHQLSDDPWLMPLSILVLCFYGWFQQAPRRLSVLLIFAFIGGMLFIHPRSLIFSIPLVIIFLFFEYRWIKQHLFFFIIILFFLLMAGFPYLLNLFKQLHMIGQIAPSISAQCPPLPLPQGKEPLVVSLPDILFPLISGGIFFSYDFLQLFPDVVREYFWLHPLIANFLIFISMLSYFLIAGGMSVTIIEIAKKFRSKNLILEDKLGLLCLLVLTTHLFQTSAFLLLKKYYPPDYHLGIWFCFFYFIWKTLKKVGQIQWLKYISPVYITALGILWINTIISIHSYGGYDLGNAIALSKKIADFSPKSNIVLLTNATHEMNRSLDKLYNKTNKVVLGFYYKNYISETENFLNKMSRNKSNMISYSLDPLVHIYRSKKDTISLPKHTLVVKPVPGEKSHKLMLINDPAKVQRELADCLQ